MQPGTIYRRLTPQAHRFIESLCDLGYLENKHKALIFERILKNPGTHHIGLTELKRILAIFLFEGNVQFSKAQEEMLKREWPQLFG